MGCRRFDHYSGEARGLCFRLLPPYQMKNTEPGILPRPCHEMVIRLKKPTKPTIGKTGKILNLFLLSSSF